MAGMRGYSSQQARHQSTAQGEEGPGEGNCLVLGHVRFLADQDLNSQLTLLAGDPECIPSPSLLCRRCKRSTPRGEEVS